MSSTVVTLNYILFIQLARKWPTFVAKWELIEHATKQFGYPLNIALKIKLILAISIINVVGMFNIKSYNIS